MTAPRTTMPVRYHPLLGWAFLVLGVLYFVVALGLLALGSPTFGLVVGVMFVVLGALYLRRPHFVYVPGTQTIEVVAPIGPARRYGAEQGGALVVDGARIYRSGADGRRKRVPVYRYMSNRSDWDAVTTALA